MKRFLLWTAVLIIGVAILSACKFDSKQLSDALSLKMDKELAQKPAPESVKVEPKQTIKLTPAEQKMVDKAKPYMPGLRVIATKYWSDMAYPATLAAQIEQESLWNPKAELCVPKGTCAREYGFGFGQLTITPRFNVFQEVKELHPDLKDWAYADRFDPDKQMLALVLKDKLHFRQCKPLMEPGIDTYACMFSSYNGGFGGVSADRRLCANTQGCNPKRWFDNVADTSTKAKVAQSGYGKSFFQINREYVDYTMYTRVPKYRVFPGFTVHP